MPLMSSRRPGALAVRLAVGLSYVVLTATCIATGYYLPTGIAVVAALVLFLALSGLTILVVMLESGLGGQAGPQAATASIGIGLTAIATVGGCALGATLR